MSDETQVNSSDENGSQSSESDKQEHIKQRLKDLGVSEESERPEKPWYKKYAIHMIVTVIVMVGVIFYLESASQEINTDSAINQKSSTDSLQQVNSVQTDFNPAMNSAGSNSRNTPWGSNNAWPMNDAMREKYKRASELQATYEKTMRDYYKQQQDNQRKSQQKILEMQNEHHKAMNKIYQTGDGFKNSNQSGNNNFYARQNTGSYPPPYWRPYSGPGYRGQAAPNNAQANSAQAPFASQHSAPPVYSNNQFANVPPEYNQRPPAYPPYGGYPDYYNGWPRY